MDLLSKINAKPLTIELTHEQMWCYYNAIKQVVDKGIPATPSEVAFLMQMMTKVAKNVDEHKATGEYETTLHKVKLNLAQWIGGWNCLNVILSNKLYNSKKQEMRIMETMTLIAPRIDEEADRPERKLTLVE